MRFSGAGGTGGMGLWRYLMPGAQADYTAMAGDLWQNTAVAASLGWIKRNFGEPTLEVVRELPKAAIEIVPDSVAVALLNRPNDFYDRHTFWSAIILSYVVDGNCYLRKIRDRKRNVIQLWWVPHWMIWPRWSLDGTEFIGWYDYQVNGKTERLEIEDVIHLRDGIDPHNDRCGYSAVKTAVRQIVGLNECDTYTAAIMRNMGIPGLIVSSADADMGFQPDEIPLLQDQFREMFTSEGRGTALFAPRPIKVEKLAFSPEQMALDKLPARLEAAICAAIGPPAMVVGLAAGAEFKTYANWLESRKAAYEDYLIPVQKAIGDGLTHQLLIPDFQEGDRFRWNYSTVQCLQENETQAADRVGRLYQQYQVITRAEAREAMGFDWTDQDEIYYPEAMLRYIDREDLPADDVRPDGPNQVGGKSADSESKQVPIDQSALQALNTPGESTKKSEALDHKEVAQAIGASGGRSAPVTVAELKEYVDYVAGRMERSDIPRDAADNVDYDALYRDYHATIRTDILRDLIEREWQPGKRLRRVILNLNLADACFAHKLTDDDVERVIETIRSADEYTPDRPYPDTDDQIRETLEPFRAIGPRATHKASSADAILAHVLRGRGWTADFRDGKLDDGRRHDLLGDVSDYATDWLRHEATRFFAAYGATDDGNGGDGRSIDRRLPGRDDFGISDRVCDRGTDGANSPGGSTGRPADQSRRQQADLTRPDCAIAGDTGDHGVADSGLQAIDPTATAAQAGGLIDGGCGLALGIGDTSSGVGDRECLGGERSPTPIAGRPRDAGEVRPGISGAMGGTHSIRTIDPAAAQAGGLIDGDESGGIDRTAGGSPTIEPAGDAGDSGVSREAGGDPPQVVSREHHLRAIDPAAAAHLGRLFRRARQFSREAHVAGAMALTGPGPLTADDLAALDLSSADQDNYFAQFQAQLLASPPDGLAANRSLGFGGPMSAAQAIGRFGAYGRDIWNRSINWLRGKFKKQGDKPEERRLSGDTSDPCDECPSLEAMGWQPIGSLPEIGATPCRQNCGCRFEYR